MVGKIPEYPKVKRWGHEKVKDILSNPEDYIVIQEKVDGANFRFWVEDGKLCFGSRRINYLDENSPEWRDCINYIKERVDLKYINEDYIYVGECMKPHTIPYDFDNIPEFILFDIIYKKTGELANPTITSTEVVIHHLPYVNTFFKGKAEDVTPELLENLLKERSAYGDVGIEGIVIKNYTKKQLCKRVTEQFLEDYKKVYGKKMKSKQSIEEKIVNRFITRARVGKVVERLKEEQGEVTERDIPKIIKGVTNDVLEEEILTIVNEMKVDRMMFKKFKKIASHKIVKIYFEMIGSV